MILDVTDLGTGVNERYKPRNHVRVEGRLYHGQDHVGSLTSLALVYTPDMIGGRFVLAWHKLSGPITQPIRIVACLEDDRCEGGTSWTINDVAIIFGGTPLAIGSLGELLGRETAFFGSNRVN